MDDEYVTRTGASYDRVAATYGAQFFDELEHKPLDRALLSCLAEMLPSNAAVADIGCGPGQVACYLHNRGLAAMGVDIAPEMVALAQRLTPAIPFRQGNLLDLPFAGGTLAGITAFYSIIHLSPTDRPRALREFYRVLGPAGLVLVAFHIGDERIHLDEWWDQPVDLDFQFIRTETLRDELEEAGFVVEMTLERCPYEPLEHPSRRGYILARKP